MYIHKSNLYVYIYIYIYSHIGKVSNLNVCNIHIHIHVYIYTYIYIYPIRNQPTYYIFDEQLTSIFDQYLTVEIHLQKIN